MVLPRQSPVPPTVASRTWHGHFVVASWTDDGPSAVTQRVRHGCQRSRHATGVSRRPNTGLSLSTWTASGGHGLASTGEPPLAAVKLERIRRREAADAYACALASPIARPGAVDARKASRQRGQS